MMHSNRIWGEPVEVTLEEFIEKVSEHTWTNCTAFKVDEYVFVNDATSGDGAQEYAVLMRENDQWFQIESWTCSWMDDDTIRKCFAELPTSEFKRPVEPTFEKHGYGTPVGPLSCCA